MALLPTPATGDEVGWVAQHLAHLTSAPVRASGTHRGGQAAADRALDGFDVTGYAAARSVVAPVGSRGASALSPWIRHGLLDLRRVWDHVDGGPERDVVAFRDELLWQEYARHLYARLGRDTRRALRGVGLPGAGAEDRRDPAADWDRLDGRMACTSAQVAALLADGWITNRGRLWLASEWSVRLGLDWGDGEDLMFRSLLDGSRAANRLGWQWTSGSGSARAWSWTREQVERLDPGRCDGCTRRHDCPVDAATADTATADTPTADTPTADTSDTPDTSDASRTSGSADTVAAPGTDDGGITGADLDLRLRRDPDRMATAGPSTVDRDGAGPPELVWLTAESLGDGDPALAAHPDLPAVFVLDEGLLTRLRLAPTRLVFLAECLADLAGRRAVEVHLGDPAHELAGRRVATTAAPVPGHRRTIRRLGDAVAEVHPWPWLVTPHDRSVRSFSAWRRHAVLP